MKQAELAAFLNTSFLNEGHEDVLIAIRPAFDKLVSDLIELPENAEIDDQLAPFAFCFESINKHEWDIETVERETILSAIYAIGNIIGLDESTQYAERWRGDW